jgi:hypothetical protein
MRTGNLNDFGFVHDTVLGIGGIAEKANALTSLVFFDFRTEPEGESL